MYIDLNIFPSNQLKFGLILCRHETWYNFNNSMIFKDGQDASTDEKDVLVRAKEALSVRVVEFSPRINKVA